MKKTTASNIDLAHVILKMTYGDLMDVAEALSQMKEPDVRPRIETPEQYANLLYDWAEAQL